VLRSLVTSGALIVWRPGVGGGRGRIATSPAGLRLSMPGRENSLASIVPALFINGEPLAFQVAGARPI
jgi:hypothetical protein